MLSVRLNHRPAGILTATPAGGLRFAYDPAWLVDKGAYALSLSMPLTAGEYGEDVAGPWFDGLLPDNIPVRALLAGRFQVDVGDDYGLLAALGRECPGAVSVVSVEASLLDEGQMVPSYDLLDTRRLAGLIRELPTRPLFVDADGELRLSLAGVHHKTALVKVGDGLALPRGGIPTSHILKIDIQGLPDTIRVEHFCLRVAETLGLGAVRSTVAFAEDQPYLLVTRYDRVLVDGAGGRTLRRLHQEDFCQALSRYPRQKYEKDGGPGWAECFALMDRLSDPAASRMRLLDYAIFQVLIGNPDAHAKNYAILYRGGISMLARLYDVNNAAAFRAHFKQQRPRLAMAIGGERNPDALEPAHWDQFAADIGIRRDLVRARLADLAGRIPNACIGLREGVRGTPADSPLLDLAVADVTARCQRLG